MQMSFGKFIFFYNYKQKNVPWYGEHLFQSLTCQHFSGQWGILIYKFIARKENITYSLSENVKKKIRSYFHSFKLSAQFPN